MPKIKVFAHTHDIIRHEAASRHCIEAAVVALAINAYVENQRKNAQKEAMLLAACQLLYNQHSCNYTITSEDFLRKYEAFADIPAPAEDEEPRSRNKRK